jgi:XTP/dITP diphosphohydrolase
MRRLLFATGNPHKLQEVKAILPAINWLSLADFPKLEKLNPQETGSTFEENALLKTKVYGDASGITTVAEDSGLEVKALNNEPGIYSARWVPGSHQDRYEALLKKLGNESDRAARYVAVACFYEPKTQEIKCFQGVVAGKIASQAQGTGGFGYDPIFIPEGYNQTFAEIELAKHQLSHRHRAFEKLNQWLLTRSGS